MRPTPEQSCRKLSLAVSPMRAGDVQLPANAKSSEIHLNPPVCVKPIQSLKEYREQGQVQIATRRRSSRMARADRCLRPARPRKIETGSNLSDGTWWSIVRGTGLATTIFLLDPRLYGVEFGFRFQHVAGCRKPRQPAIQDHVLHHQNRCTLRSRGGFDRLQAS